MPQTKRSRKQQEPEDEVEQQAEPDEEPDEEEFEEDQEPDENDDEGEQQGGGGLSLRVREDAIEIDLPRDGNESNTLEQLAKVVDQLG
jgi:hypothetical protein